MERLDRCMIRGFTGSREVEFDAAPVRPLIQNPPDKLRAIVTPDGVGLAPGLNEPIQDPHLVEALTVKIASYVFQELETASKDPKGPLHRDLYAHLLRKMG